MQANDDRVWDTFVVTVAAGDDQRVEQEIVGGTQDDLWRLLDDIEAVLKQHEARVLGSGQRECEGRLGGAQG